METFPAATGQVQKDLAAKDVADIAPEGSGTDIVQLLKKVAVSTDPIIEEGLGQAIRKGHYYKNSKALKKSRALYGNEIGEGGTHTGYRNEYINSLVDDEAQAMYGDRINMKTSFWDAK